MLRYDWVTYISAPNFLRAAPILTFPIGRTPDYMAPVGSSLGLADASPYMVPVYRLLNFISPDHPTQILGWLVLASYVLTFYWSVKFLRRAYVAMRGQQRRACSSTWRSVSPRCCCSCCRSSRAGSPTSRSPSNGSSSPRCTARSSVASSQDNTIGTSSRCASEPRCSIRTSCSLLSAISAPYLLRRLRRQLAPRPGAWGCDRWRSRRHQLRAGLPGRRHQHDERRVRRLRRRLGVPREPAGTLEARCPEFPMPRRRGRGSGSSDWVCSSCSSPQRRRSQQAIQIAAVAHPGRQSAWRVLSWRCSPPGRRSTSLGAHCVDLSDGPFSLEFIGNVLRGTGDSSGR